MTDHDTTTSEGSEGENTANPQDTDEVLVYTETTISKPPSEVTEEYLDEHFDADLVHAYHRRKQDRLAETGDKPYTYVCPECGEGTWTADEFDDVWYYYHHDNQDCPLDVRDARDKHATDNDATPTQSLRERLGMTALTLGVAGAVMYGVLRVLPKSTITVNGEPMTIPPTEMVWPVFGIIAFVMFVIAVIPYLPGKVNLRGGRRA